MKSIYFFLAFLASSLLFSVCFAQAPIVAPENLDQAVGLIPALINAFKQGHFLLAGAGATLIVTFVLKQYVLPKLSLGTGVLPLVSTIIGVLIGWAISVLGGANSVEAMLAVMSGPLASSLWDNVVKYFFPKPTTPVAKAA